jgi:hypothetical protein
MLPSSDLARVVQWFAELVESVGDSVRALLCETPPPAPLSLAPSGDSTPSARWSGVFPRIDLEPGSPAAPLPPDGSARLDLEWSQWLDDIARPELRALREHVQTSLRALEASDPLAAVVRSLDRAVSDLPETVELVASPPAEGDVSTAEVPLRRYLQLAFLPAVRDASGTLRAGLIDALREQSRRIDEIERVLDYYGLAVQRHAAELEDPEQVEALARTGRERLRSLLDELQSLRTQQARRAIAELVESAGGALEDACAPYRSHRPDEVRRGLEALERAVAAAPTRPPLLERTKSAARRAYRVARPLGRRVALELRTLFSERESDASQRAWLRLLSAGASELGRDLPPGYRRLFAIGPIEAADTYVRRGPAETALRAAIEAWKNDAPQSVLLHGDRGSGKRTLANQVLADLAGSMRVRWIRLGPRTREEPVVARSLAKAMGVRSDVARLAALARLRPHDERRRVVVIENADRLLVPSAEGIAGISSLLRLVGDTASSVLWILLMATPAADLALHRLDLAHRIPTIVGLDPMQPAELRALLTSRHRLSGFHLEFAPLQRRLVDHVRHPLAELRAARTPSEAFFERLARLTGGNPRQALFCWLACAGVHPQREDRILVRGLPTSTTDLLGRVGLSQRLILALLAQYASLGDDELRSLLAATIDGVDGDLQVLRARGLVMPSREHEGHFTLHPTIAHALVLELRAANMI